MLFTARSLAIRCRRRSLALLPLHARHLASTTSSTPPSNSDIGNVVPATTLSPKLAKLARPRVAAILSDEVDLRRDICGPWILLSEELQGELVLDGEGFCYFRPGNCLGLAIGRIVLEQAQFELQLEAYLYGNNATEYPPLRPVTYHLKGNIGRAVTDKQHQFATLTLVGQAMRTSAGAPDGKTFAFHGAKVSPWDRSLNPPWRPSRALRDSFASVFASSAGLNSHKLRGENDDGPSSNERTSGEAPQKSTCIRPRIDLSRYRVGDVPSIFYIPDYLSLEDEAAILRGVRSTPKEYKTELPKRVAHEWGCTLCDQCNMSFLPDETYPAWAKELFSMLLWDRLFTATTFPNYVRVQEYEAGGGIAPHCDGPVYVPHMAILSAQSPAVMSFFPPEQAPKQDIVQHFNDSFRFPMASGVRPVMSLILEPRSLLIIEDEAFRRYPRGILDHDVDLVDPQQCGPVVNRSAVTQIPSHQSVLLQAPRVSVTCMTLLPLCCHQPQRAEYFAKSAWYSYNRQEPPPATPCEALPSRKRREKRLASTAAGSVNAVSELGAKVNDLLARQQDLSKRVQEMQSLIEQLACSSLAFQETVASTLNALAGTPGPAATPSPSPANVPTKEGETPVAPPLPQANGSNV